MHLGVSAASATNMLKKLAALGLVDHINYRGAELTQAGRVVALEVILSARRNWSLFTPLSVGRRRCFNPDASETSGKGRSGQPGYHLASAR